MYEFIINVHIYINHHYQTQENRNKYMCVCIHMCQNYKMYQNIKNRYVYVYMCVYKHMYTYVYIHIYLHVYEHTFNTHIYLIYMNT
jgi:hypothetical protein